MGVVFKGVGLLPGAVTRLRPGIDGQQVVRRDEQSPDRPGLEPIGALDPEAVVEGRARAPTREALWGVIDDARVWLTSPPTVGDLTVSGRELGSMALVSLEIVGTLEQGREHSAMVRLRFVRFVHAGG
jgi:hypothetical protein